MAHYKSAALHASLLLLATAMLPGAAFADASGCAGIGTVVDPYSDTVVNSAGQVDCIAGSNENSPGVTISLYDGEAHAAAPLYDPQTSSYSYDGGGQMLSDSTNPSGYSVTNTYDSAGNMIQSEDALGTTFQYSYDADGDVIRSLDAAGTTQYHYDSQGELTQQTDPVGNSTQYSYDGQGRLTETQDYNSSDQLQYTTQYTYDAQERLIEFTEENSTDQVLYTTQYTYDDAGQLTQTDANGNVTNYQYDALGRLQNTCDGPCSVPADIVTTYSYDAANNLASLDDPSGAATLLFSNVPEPGTLSLVIPALAGIVGLAGRRRRRAF